MNATNPAAGSAAVSNPVDASTLKEGETLQIRTKVLKDGTSVSNVKKLKPRKPSGKPFNKDSKPGSDTPAPAPVTPASKEDVDEIKELMDSHEKLRAIGREESSKRELFCRSVLICFIGLAILVGAVNVFMTRSNQKALNSLPETIELNVGKGFDGMKTWLSETFTKSGTDRDNHVTSDGAATRAAICNLVASVGEISKQLNSQQDFLKGKFNTIDEKFLAVTQGQGMNVTAVDEVKAQIAALPISSSSSSASIMTPSPIAAPVVVMYPVKKYRHNDLADRYRATKDSSKRYAEYWLYPDGDSDYSRVVSPRQIARGEVVVDTSELANGVYAVDILVESDSIPFVKLKFWFFETERVVPLSEVLWVNPKTGEVEINPAKFKGGDRLWFQVRKGEEGRAWLGKLQRSPKKK